MTSPPTEPERGDPSDAPLLAAEAERRDDDAEVGERVQVERAVTPWRALLAGSVGRSVEIVTGDGVGHRGSVGQVGDSWCLVEVAGRAVLVPLGQVLTVAGLQGPAPRAPSGPGMGWVLRRWGQMRSTVIVHLLDGSSRTGQVVDVVADAFTLGTDRGRSSALTIPTAAVRWAVGDRLMDAW